MDKIEQELKIVRCQKCGKYNSKIYLKKYGTCLCGNVLDKKAKFQYEMNKKLRLWRGKNIVPRGWERYK